MDDSSDDGAAVLAHATPGRRHGWASVHTPIDWSSAASLRAELARVDARRATLLNALAALEDGVEALNNSSSDEESCCDLTQATAEGGDRTPPPNESSDEDLVDLTQSRVRARDAPTPARDGASSSSDDDDGPNIEADARVAIAQRIKASPELYEPILLRKKVDVNEIARVCRADAKTVKAYLDDEGVPNVRRRAAPKRTRVRSPQPGA